MSDAHIKIPVATHVPDANWLIALWFAIHGGDPVHESQLSAAELRTAAIDIIAAVAPLTRPEHLHADLRRDKPDEHGAISVTFAGAPQRDYYCVPTPKGLLCKLGHLPPTAPTQKPPPN